MDKQNLARIKAYTVTTLLASIVPGLLLYQGFTRGHVLIAQCLGWAGASLLFAALFVFIIGRAFEYFDQEVK